MPAIHTDSDTNDIACGLGTGSVNWHLVVWGGGVQVFGEGWALVCVIGLGARAGGVGLDRRVAVHVLCGEEVHVGP